MPRTTEHGNRVLGVLGVPTSAGAFAPGQEEAPRALRDAGLLGLLRDAGIAVSDHGDRPVWRWRPDRGRPRAQNLHTVVSIVRETAARVADAAATGEVTLVLGGDCTVGIGTVAGHVAAAPDERVGLIYLDSHADLNIPESVHEGALDWMGMAHMLAIGGAEPELVRVGGRVPLLEADRVVLVGWGPEQATEFERAAIAERGLGVVGVDRVAADPEAAALKARRRLRRCDRILVHFDVDLIDFTETPLSENWGRNEGVAFDTALRAFSVLVADPALAAVTITELNPNHTEEGAGTVERFARAIATSLGAPGCDGGERADPGRPPRGPEQAPFPSDHARRRSSDRAEADSDRVQLLARRSSPDEGTESWRFCFSLPENRQPDDPAQLEFLRSAYAHGMGRTAYEGIASAMTTSTDHPFAEILTAARKVVFSRTLKTADWANTTIAAGDTAEEIDKLKRGGDGHVVVWGGVSL